MEAIWLRIVARLLCCCWAIARLLSPLDTATKTCCSVLLSKLRSRAGGRTSLLEPKHLITLEPGISEAQTDEMGEERISLVVPAPIQGTYTNRQRSWLITFSALLEELKVIQR